MQVKGEAFCSELAEIEDSRWSHVIAKHVEIEGDRLQIRIDRGENVSILENAVETPAIAGRAA